MPFWPRRSRSTRSLSSPTPAPTRPRPWPSRTAPSSCETEQGGKAASQDVGLPYVTGDILVCIDADTVIDVDVVERFVDDLDAGADAPPAQPAANAASARLLAREPPLRLCARALLVALVPRRRWES